MVGLLAGRDAGAAASQTTGAPIGSGRPHLSSDEGRSMSFAARHGLILVYASAFVVPRRRHGGLIARNPRCARCALVPWNGT